MTQRLLALASLVGLSVSASAQLVWTRADDGRTDHAVATLAGQVVMFGGAGSSGLLPDTWEWLGARWRAHTPLHSPPPRQLHAMAGDTARGRIVLFGGIGEGAFFGDTWKWDGIDWARIWTAAAPSARAGHALTFDARRGRVVLFGGYDANGFLGDTWEWDGQAWAQVATSGPAPRRGHGLVHDAGRAVSVLFGGRGGAGVLGDTWEWDGSVWRQSAGAGPSARHGHGLAFDPLRARVVLFGGTSAAGLLADTWEWDGATWSLAATATAPGERSGVALAFDALRARVVAYGGLGASAHFGDTWTWDGVGWTEPSPLTRPSPRASTRMAWDERRGVMVLFGGYSNTMGSDLGDTWEWDGVRWTRTPTPSAPSPRYGCGLAYDALRGRTLLFSGHGGNQTLADTWEWDGVTWSQRNPATTVPLGAVVGMAFDRTRGVVVLHVRTPGGGSDDTWEWDDTDWRRLAHGSFPYPAAALTAIAFSSDRGRIVGYTGDQVGSAYVGAVHEWNGGSWVRTYAVNPPTTWAQFPRALVHDGLRGRTVVQLGSGGATTQWDWDGGAWSQRQLGIYPPAGQLAAVAFDGSRGRVLQFAGGANDLDQTWQCFTLSPATFATYGRGCPGTNGTPRLTSTTRPWTSDTLRTELSGARPFAPAVLMNGFSRTAFAGGALPFNLAGLGAPACDLLTSVDFTLNAHTSPAGTAAIDLRLPDDASWIGTEFFQQFAVLDLAANALGLAASQGGAATIGAR